MLSSPVVVKFWTIAGVGLMADNAGFGDTPFLDLEVESASMNSRDCLDFLIVRLRVQGSSRGSVTSLRTLAS